MQRRVFPQARAQATYQALVTASRTVFANKGFDDTQTPDIAAAAGVSVGTFYRYFTDKRQAFVEMIGHHLAEANADVMSKLTAERFAVGGGDDRRAAIDTVLEVVFAHVRRFPDLEGVYLAMSLRDPDVARLRSEYEALGCESLARLIDVLCPRAVVPDPRAAAFVIHYAVLEVAMARSTARKPAFPVSEREVKRALREMVHRYLFPESHPPARARRTL